MPTTTRPSSAYLALTHVADQIAAANWAKQAKAHGRKRGTAPFHVTEAHRDVVTAALDVMNGRMDVESAMALVHRPDVVEQRFGR